MEKGTRDIQLTACADGDQDGTSWVSNLQNKAIQTLALTLRTLQTLQALLILVVVRWTDGFMH
jgi:hypothetical protein